ncbi:MAG TPA: SAM-dependent methyltransferase [Stenotrophomonas sp.]|uniref:class I SAM-dependent methyltransferase n=1 Tax=Stenotrophomonas sp. TaxID=69392 RepID=UPI000E951D17|nr:class I SAM-dependent methyltransferase [Stenotrophomonas sp.]HBS62535.1 SAM-dependent methyltransferase [Stenotrophomonas sp.]
MTDTPQHALWNGPAGQAWVQAQCLLDAMFAPLARVLADAVPPGADWQVLDVGCGTGAVSLAIACRLGTDGHCTGVDISAPMIDTARARARDDAVAATFLVADAQRHAFPAARLDRVVSRFGVMFFDDPQRAFAGLRDATRTGGALHAIVWRAAAENPFMTIAERAAAPLLPLPPRPTGGPGQFAFADRDAVADLLAASGWSDIRIEPLDVVCRITRAELTRYVALLGPVGQALRDPDVDAALRTRVLAAMDAAFAPFIDGDTVAFTAACWALHARAP